MTADATNICGLFITFMFGTRMWRLNIYKTVLVAAGRLEPAFLLCEHTRIQAVKFEFH